MSSSLLRRAVRGFAAYDLIVTLPFATPWTAEAMLGVMRWMHESLALGGEAMPVFTPVHVFFVALFGVLAVIWALVRVLQPTALHGAIDTAGRGLVSAWMVLVLTQGASQVLGVFLVMEAAGLFVQGALLLGARSRAAAAPATGT
ncbi:hypothetical protein [Corallococcus exiguus]|uniref:Uncharacterized protein n=1 Tax=Corallococcus exiguus TaxID=83462 RepID=A0A7X5BT52_9BACT|nr:hypothetical protein [Corallococcus exiguus]NBC45016.1 hypothetical protein [Corallococcus exiguus]TNV53746.1 hypothetical protein FH620_34730 [Corallococcus exiguus]